MNPQPLNEFIRTDMTVSEWEDRALCVRECRRIHGQACTMLSDRENTCTHLPGLSAHTHMWAHMGNTC